MSASCDSCSLQRQIYSTRCQPVPAAGARPASPVPWGPSACSSSCKSRSQTVQVHVQASSSSAGGSYAPRSAQATTPTYDPRKKVVVVGGGWAGFGAAKHLAEQGYAVTLLEAAKNPGGLSGGGCTVWSVLQLQMACHAQAEVPYQQHCSASHLSRQHCRIAASVSRG